jgi:hypothetical protein
MRFAGDLNDDALCDFCINESIALSNVQPEKTPKSKATNAQTFQPLQLDRTVDFSAHLSSVQRIFALLYQIFPSNKIDASPSKASKSFRYGSKPSLFYLLCNVSDIDHVPPAIISSSQCCDNGLVLEAKSRIKQYRSAINTIKTKLLALINLHYRIHDNEDTITGLFVA